MTNEELEIRITELEERLFYLEDTLQQRVREEVEMLTEKVDEDLAYPDGFKEGWKE